MNEAYLLAAPKEQLEGMGVIKGGFLKKTEFDPSNVNKAQCRKIDMRSFNELEVVSKKPKLLTPAPKSSYTFEDAGNGKKRLVILDTQAFWSVSNLVVIQL